MENWWITNCLYYSFQYLHFIFTCQIKYQPQKTVSFVVLIVESDQDLNLRLCIQTKIQFWSLLKNAQRLQKFWFWGHFSFEKLVEVVWNGILLAKLFWPTVRKNCHSDQEKTFEILGWRPRICKDFEIPRTICSNSERSEIFLVTACMIE